MSETAAAHGAMTSEQEARAAAQQAEADQRRAQGIVRRMESGDALPSLPASERAGPTPGEWSQVEQVLRLQMARLEQVSALSEQMWTRAQGVMTQMIDTMRLMQEVIGNSDEATARLNEQTARMATLGAALITVDQDLQQAVFDLEAQAQSK